jgi:hypothetical protein
MLRETNDMKDVVVTRKTMEYDGVNVTYATMNITGQDIMKFFPIGTRTLSFNSQMMLNEQEKKNSTKNTKVETKKDVSRKDRFILTYLTWIIVHRVLKPWPKKRSWFELSLVAHAVILSGWRSCLLAVRTSKLPTEIVMEKEMIFLSDTFVQENVVLWKYFYPYQWKQTERTMEKLYVFDKWNTGNKLPIKGAGVLAYPKLFIEKFVPSEKKKEM